MKDDFEAQVCRQMRSLKERTHDELLLEVGTKRIEWIRRRNRQVAGSVTPRKAYELFLIEYLGLAYESVPIVSENDDEIVWDSTNECPTLDACNRLGLDTKTVCRQVYEKSTQAFMSELDPQLRFWRSYDHIRPHAPSCREAIYRTDFETMMRLAIEDAELVSSTGNETSGAVLVFGQDVIAAGHHGVLEHHEPSGHAAIDAIRMGKSALGDSNLCGAMLFITREPCLVCTAEAIQANLTTVVYGATSRDSSNPATTSASSSCRALVERAPIWMEVLGGVLEKECQSLLL